MRLERTGGRLESSTHTRERPTATEGPRPSPGQRHVAAFAGALLAILVAGALAVASLRSLSSVEASLLRSVDSQRHLDAALAAVQGVISAAALALVLAAVAALGLRTEARRRTVAEATLRDTNQELEASVRERTIELERSNTMLQAEVADRRRIETELEDSRARLGRIIESAMDAIITVDGEQRIVLFNRAAEAMFQRPAAAVLGQTLDLLLPPRFRDQHHSHIAGFAQSGTTRRRMGALGAVSGVRADGTEFPMEASISKATAGDSQLLTVILRDITDRVRTEVELRESNALLEKRVAERTGELKSAKERAESADRLKSSFLATMSHELRTPLNSIIGFTGLMLQGIPGPLNEEQSKQLGLVMNSGRHLLALINDILDISKIEADEMEVSRLPFPLSEAVAKSAEMIAPLAAKKNLRFTVSLSPDLGVISSDRRRVEQVLINLLGNAVKFTERGAIELACSRESDRVFVRVSDTGIGVKKEDLASLFQPFGQLDTGLSRNYDGTGLGLAICRRLLRLLGGEISVQSEWGRGSTFEFWLPAAVGPDDVRLQAAP